MQAWPKVHQLSEFMPAELRLSGGCDFCRPPVRPPGSAMEGPNLNQTPVRHQNGLRSQDHR